MAEINNHAVQQQHKGGVRRSKKLSTKVDLTPMVDLGFLLITFFVFTTSMSRPTAMKLYLPAGEIPGTKYAESTALTVIPISNGKVFYYHGDLEKALATNRYGVTNFSIRNGLGDIIRQQQMALGKNPAFKKDDLTLIIKPAAGASYQHVVDALDEVLINNLRHYAFTDLDLFEKETLVKFNIN